MAPETTTTEFTKCPNCEAAWGSVEQTFQSCDTCGYPLHDEEFDFSDWDKVKKLTKKH